MSEIPSYNPEEKDNEVEAEEIIEIRGRKYRKVLVPEHTLRSYYSQSGPGWDFRITLLDYKHAALYGRTFTHDEVMNPEKLPEIPCYTLDEIK